MLHPLRTVTTPLTLFLSAVTGDSEIAAELRYDPSDPLAVALAIGVESAEPVVWIFGRDLLALGVRQASGEGDITVEPTSDSDRRDIRITLATNCVATMVAPRDRIVEFLVESFTVVASGCEFDRIDVDAEIAALLG
jgi:Streptomyces sporulation and cell division protein, SsgA